LRCSATFASGGRPGAAHPAAGAARELPRRLRAAVDDLGDLVERDREHVVEDEGEPLGGRQRLEHDEQRESDRVGKQPFLLGVALGIDADDRVGEPGIGRLFTRGAARPQDIEADACDDRRQPARKVLDRAAVDSVQPQPGFLHCVLALVERAKHLVRHPPQVRTVLLELLGQPVALGHARSRRRQSRRLRSFPAPAPAKAAPTLLAGSVRAFACGASVKPTAHVTSPPPNSSFEMTNWNRTM